MNRDDNYHIGSEYFTNFKTTEPPVDYEEDILVSFSLFREKKTQTWRYFKHN